nr:MAG TPA: hypothetical protein [Inoviridae sp.]
MKLYMYAPVCKSVHLENIKTVLFNRCKHML